MKETETYPAFSEHRVFEYFKKIRNRLKRHYPEDILLACIIRLNKKFNTIEENIQELRWFPPWFLYLLIKWTIKYGEYLSPDRKPLTEKDFRYLINLIHDYFGVQRGPNDYGGIYLFFRTVAFQQFWLQENFTVNRLGRQSKLFSNLPTNHYFKTIFYDQTNIQIDHFLELSFALLAHFLTKEELFITKKWFSTLEKSYPPSTIDNYLLIMSKEREELKKYLDSLPKVSLAYEFQEQTPLQRYPLLQIRENFYCYSENLLSLSVQNLVYDILRNKDTSKFMEKFGTIFERYVEEGIKNTSLTYYNEDQLKHFLNQKEKIVDFIITEPSINVFIDAKGIELSYLGMVSHLSEVVTDKTRTSAIKGVEQYYSTVNQILTKDFIDIKGKDNFLIIVTYKDIYLGNGKDFLDNIAKEKYNLILEKYPNCSFLKTDNIYFISIDDFDLLIELLKRKTKNLSEIFRFVVNNDKDYSTKKFLFRQHLNELNKDIKDVSYLKEEFDKMAKSCANKLQLTSGSS